MPPSAEHSVVYLQVRRQVVGLAAAPALVTEMEEAGVVAVVRVAELLYETTVDAGPVRQAEELAVLLNAPVLGHAEEDQAVYSHLDRVI